MSPNKYVLEHREKNLLAVKSSCHRSLTPFVKLWHLSNWFTPLWFFVRFHWIWLDFKHLSVI